MTDESDLRPHLPLKPLEFLVLAVLEESALHGYAMVERIESRSDGIVRVRPGDLYRVLYRLQKRGLLENVPGEGDERRAYYALTTLGHRVLLAEAAMLRKMAAGVGGKKRESHA